jgi:hypothetical protein
MVRMMWVESRQEVVMNLGSSEGLMQQNGLEECCMRLERFYRLWRDVDALYERYTRGWDYEHARQVFFTETELDLTYLQGFKLVQNFL